MSACGGSGGHRPGIAQRNLTTQRNSDIAVSTRITQINLQAGAHNDPTYYMTFKLRPKMLLELLRRLRMRSPPNHWRFARAVRDVIGARMLRAITGELSVAEAWRMVEEKRRAAVQASFAYTEAILNGEAASALRAYFDVYRRAVESNRKRLSIRRWRWPWLR